MSLRLVNILLLAGLSICYLEWGKGNSGLLIGIEYELFVQSGRDVRTFTHPFILLPLIGQVLLLVNCCLPQPRKWLTITGIVLPGALVLMVLLVGILAKNPKIIVSTLLFIGVSVYFFVKRKSVK
jgi:hypothetical protein